MLQWILMLMTAGAIRIETEDREKNEAECRQTRQIVLHLQRLLRVSWTVTKYLSDYSHEIVKR
jgi:hypothetical protein